MKDDKNLQNPQTHTDNPQGSGDYRFVNETIKSKPLNKKKAAVRIASIAAGAVLFGVLSAAVMAYAYPVFQNQFHRDEEPDPVDIQVEEPTPTPEETPQETPQTEVVEVPRNVTLEDYEHIYDEVRQIADSSLQAMVTVTGVADEEDVLDNSYVRFGQCSGVIIAENDQEYYILTQLTGLGDGTKTVQVTFSDGRIVQGSMRKSDLRTSLAVVSVRKEGMKKKTIDNIQVASLGSSYSLMQGKPVIAIGSPSGYNEAVAYGNIISVSNKVSVTDAEYNLLVTDILGSPDGSGVLLDTEGKVIGIIAQSFGDSSDTMVKALSVSQLKSLLSVLSNGEEICYAGIQGQDVTEESSESIGIPEGIYVDAVEAESPAMEAGVQSGDVITVFNGEDVKTVQDFATELQKCHKDDKVTMKVMRRGNEGYAELELEMTIAVR